MFDSGAKPNIIQLSALRDDIYIYTSNPSLIRGVSEQNISTLGTTMIKLADLLTKFAVVNDHFPISTNASSKSCIEVKLENGET